MIKGTKKEKTELMNLIEKWVKSTAITNWYFGFWVGIIVTLIYRAFKPSLIGSLIFNIFEMTMLLIFIILMRRNNG